MPQAADGAPFTVNTTTDAAPVANACVSVPSCSLREAIVAANANPDADVITVPGGTYTLTQGTLTVTNPVTIDGAGARSTTVDGNDASRVFTINNSGTITTITGLTVTGGNADATAPVTAGNGGGFLTGPQANLVLRGTAVVGNRASLSGGGISYGHTGATGTIESSLIAGNTAGDPASVMAANGGGIFAQGGLTVSNSTITDNSARTTLAAQGGGILALAMNVNLVNNTVSDNTAAGGTSMGGGIMNAATLSATNTIVAGNTGGDCGAAALGATLANNLSGDASCGFTGAAGTQNANPALGPLADNGGPTNTRAIAQSSPAANAGTATGCPATDQRGVARPQGPACDIGAFEAPYTAPGAGGGAATPPVTPPRTSAGRKPGLKVTGVPKRCRRSKFEIRLRSSVSGTGVKLRSVRVTLNGKKLRTVTKAGRFRVKIDAKKLKAGRKYTIRVRATDSKGRATAFKKSFKRCKAKTAKRKKR
ncbi:MAG TPA: choice-of-anchor Q domain-containing protein [Thermoleophilaceae bacterium]|nr:choice-of-anchor Q domain-containing protein [Thermoleophilaceae bacterium]